MYRRGRSHWQCGTDAGRRHRRHRALRHRLVDADRFLDVSIGVGEWLLRLESAHSLQQRPHAVGDGGGRVEGEYIRDETARGRIDTRHAVGRQVGRAPRDGRTKRGRQALAINLQQLQQKLLGLRETFAHRLPRERLQAQQVRKQSAELVEQRRRVRDRLELHEVAECQLIERRRRRLHGGHGGRQRRLGGGARLGERRGRTGSGRGRGCGRDDGCLGPRWWWRLWRLWRRDDGGRWWCV